MIAVRREERERILREISGPGPSLVLVGGPRGVGVTAFLRDSLREIPHLYHSALPVSEVEQILHLAARLDAETAPGAGAPSLVRAEDPRWDDLFRGLIARFPGGEAGRERVEEARREMPSLAAGPAARSAKAGVGIRAGDEGADLEGEKDSPEPLVIVLDDATDAFAGGPRFAQALEAFWERAGARRLPVKIVLAGTDLHQIEALAPETPLRKAVTGVIELRPFSYLGASVFFPAFSLRDRLRAWAIFGGRPSVLSRIDDAESLEENVHRLLLSPEAPLRGTPLLELKAELQVVSRYVGVLSAVASGARTWREIRERAPVFATGGEMAPYVRKLEELGLLRILRPLGSKEGARNRRYTLSDPFHAFWYRFILPLRSELQGGTGDRVWEERIRPHLAVYVQSLFAEICRDFMRERAESVLGGRAREVGSVWSSRTEIEVAGRVEGGAVFYGAGEWGGEPVDAGTLAELDRSIGRTRWGIERERRFRILFSPTTFTEELRRTAGRAEDLRLVGLEELFGG